MNIVKIHYPDDEHLEILVNGEIVAFANHDEEGFAGMDAVHRTASIVGATLGALVIEE